MDVMGVMLHFFCCFEFYVSLVLHKLKRFDPLQSTLLGSFNSEVALLSGRNNDTSTAFTFVCLIVFKGITSKICRLLFENTTFKVGPSSPAQSAHASGGPTCLRSGNC